jgi:hypothetical protein
MKPKSLAVAVLGLVFLCGCCKRGHTEQATTLATNDVGRFQLFYAPFPTEADSLLELSNAVNSTRYSRLFYIDTKTGKVWVYSPESIYGSTEQNSAVEQHEGFTPIAVVDSPKKLWTQPGKNPSP